MGRGTPSGGAGRGAPRSRGQGLYLSRGTREEGVASCWVLPFLPADAGENGRGSRLTGQHVPVAVLGAVLRG